MRSLQLALAAVLIAGSLARAAQPDLSGLDPKSAITVRAADDAIELAWPVEDGQASFRIVTGARPVFSAGLTRDGTPKPIFSDAALAYTLRIGQRDLKPSGWTAFFDRVDERPFQAHPLQIQATTAKVTSTPSRAVVTLGPVTAPGFTGDLQLTFFAGSPMVQVEAVVSTAEDSRAILYDAALELPRQSAPQIAFETYDKRLTKLAPDQLKPGPVRTRLRTMVAQTAGGTVAIFPPPHQYFYPLDFANNYGFNEYALTDDHLRLGIRQPPHGDRRFRPWVNSPPGTHQRLCLFLQIDDGSIERALDRVRALTRDDRVPEVTGYKSMVSHLHVEHTAEFLRQQREAADPDSVPYALLEPGWVKILKDTGIQIVHFAEFHFGDTPKRDAKRRITELRAFHSELARLSTDNFLLLPGEEPNVHLGGHWISFFPRPIYWVLNRAEGEPFTEEIEGLGTLYRVGSAADVLELMKRENGLMWTAHPRIKGSQAFPDAYFPSEYFQSPHFLGAAWKAMPADYSLDRLGTRVLNLADDMANRGSHKHILGEIDIFQLDPTYELYGHLNVNYVQLPTLPKFTDSWQPILDCLRNGKFFTTTGEVLITDLSIAGATSGDQATVPANPTEVRATLTFTFPPAFAEVVSGDGQQVYRDRLDLSHLPAYTTQEIKIPVNLAGRTWARLEAWDVARNGAFTPPVWIKK